MSIQLIVGSNNQNLKLAKTIQDRLTATGHQSNLVDLVSLDLPLYSPASDTGTPDVLTPLLPELHRASAFVFIAPEYNGGLPPVLTNFIAWVSRSGDDWRAVFNGKTAAVASFSGTGQNILQMMRLQLAYIGLNVIGRQLLATFSKPINDESVDAVIAQLTV